MKIHYVYNLIVTEKSMTSITFLGCFMKLDVCVLLNTFYGSVLALIGFAINTLRFQDFVHSLGRACIHYSSNAIVLFCQSKCHSRSLTIFLWEILPSVCFLSFHYNQFQNNTSFPTCQSFRFNPNTLWFMCNWFWSYVAFSFSIRTLPCTYTFIHWQEATWTYALLTGEVEILNDRSDVLPWVLYMR